MTRLNILFDNDWLQDVLVSFLHYQVLLGPLFLLMIEEAGIPLPVPGDIVIAYTGYQVSRGTISYPTAFISLVIAVLMGSSILYFISRRWGPFIVTSIGKYIHLDQKKLDAVEQKFQKYGLWVIIFGRHIPGFRIPITVFSGISKVSYKTFIASTFISIIFWIPLYLDIGRRLGPKTAILLHAHRTYFLFFGIPLLFFFVAFLFMRYKNKKQTKTKIEIM